VTQPAPLKALKSVACCKLTFDQKVVAHRVVGSQPAFRVVRPTVLTTVDVELLGQGVS